MTALCCFSAIRRQPHPALGTPWAPERNPPDSWRQTAPIWINVIGSRSLGASSFVSPTGEGVRFDLHTDQRVISVHVADAAGLNLSVLPEARSSHWTGAWRHCVGPDLTRIGRLFLASAKDLAFVEPAPPARSTGATHQFCCASAELAHRECPQTLPVRVRTVTGAKNNPRTLDDLSGRHAWHLWGWKTSPTPRQRLANCGSRRSYRRRRFPPPLSPKRSLASAKAHHHSGNPHLDQNCSTAAGMCNGPS